MIVISHLGKKVIYKVNKALFDISSGYIKSLMYQNLFFQLFYSIKLGKHYSRKQIGF